jgi:lipopolysaccharide export system protein LptA
MYKRRLNQAKKIKVLIAIFFTLMVNCVYGLSTDSEQNIEIEADTAEMDDVNKITIYRGNVIVTQGSIKMTGHTMTVHFDKNNNMELAVMNGTPATYRQLPDDSTVFDEAEALQMEYDALKNYVILIDQALVTQEGLQFSGKRIEYDTVLSKVKAEGQSKTVAKKEKSGEKTKDGRVKIIIKKKKQK